MRSHGQRFIVARERNVVRVDFNREPDPPAPRFPGARGMRPLCTDEAGDPAPACAASAAA